MQSMQAESVFAISELTVGYIERPFILLKDKFFPPSQATLDKRLAGNAKAYMFGIKNSLKIVKDALAKGANPNVMLDTVDADWNPAGKQPVLFAAVQRNLPELASALVGAGANIELPDDKGNKTSDIKLPLVAELKRLSASFSAAQEPAAGEAPKAAAAPAASKPACHC